MDNLIPVPMRLVEPLRPRSCSQSRKRLLPSLRMRRGGAPKCEGFAFAEARVGSGASEHQRRDSPLSYLHAPSLPTSDCAEEIYSSERSCSSLSCSVTSGACDCRDEMNEIEVRGPTSIAMSRPVSTRATTTGSKATLSPPVVSPGRSLELTTQLGMARMKAELEAKVAADPPKTDREEAQGRLRSAKLRPLGYIPIEMQPRAACIGITPVSDMPHCPSTRPRSSTEVAREQNMALLEEQMHIRSHSAHVMRQRQSFLSISRDSGAVASAKVSRQEEAGSSPESPLTETEEPSTARHMRLEPGTIPRKISTPIPHNRHEVVEAGSSLSVRGYSSPPSDAPPPAPTAHLPLVVPGPMYTPQLVAGIEADQKPGRVAMVVSARSPGTFTTLRGNSSFRHRHWSTGDSSASPSRKLHPLRGCVSPQPLTAVKGLRLQTSPSSEPCSSKGPNPLHDTTLATET